MGRRLGPLQGDCERLLNFVDWTQIFIKRPDLAPPGYAEAVEAGHQRSQQRYEEKGKKRAKGSKGKRGKFPGMKHGAI
jgi:hypothetical protein